MGDRETTCQVSSGMLRNTKLCDSQNKQTKSHPLGLK